MWVCKWNLGLGCGCGSVEINFRVGEVVGHGDKMIDWIERELAAVEE